MGVRGLDLRLAGTVQLDRRGRVGGKPPVAVVIAARTLAEFLEPRRLLAGITSSGIMQAGITQAGLQASVPSGVIANLTPTGAAELSMAPHAAGTGVTTPQYIELDSQPQISTAGNLSPFSTPAPTGLLPATVRHAYGVDQITFGSVQGNGAGQTIAIVDAYNYPTASTDLHAFDVASGLPDPPSFTQVNQTGGSSLPGVDNSQGDSLGNDWEVEESLDIEWSHAMAPEANIVLVEANSDGDTDLINAAIGYARSAPGVVAVSMSWGESEDPTETGLDSLFTTPAGHNGVTFVASSGDSAAPADYPAYSPNVVAAGGTTLYTNTGGVYSSETGWSDSGGGISAYESQPSYQTGVVTQSTTARTAPDVAFDSDPNTGVSIYDSYDFGTTNPWVTVGGTSVASPCWAGLISIADQGRSLNGGTSLDGVSQTLPKLYSISESDFHDITSGNNGYAAGPGYDLVTGRGSPVANTLIYQLAAAGPFITSASPTGIQSAAPTSLTFDFSGAMNTSSFSIANSIDSFTGPNSVNLISTINSYSWTSSSTLQVNFTAPTVQGPYTMVIGPNILSIGGAEMDQNQDGIAGEVPGDEFTTKFNYDSTPLQVASTTPTNGGIIETSSSVLSVTFNHPIDPNSANISNLNVSEGSVSAVHVLSGNTTVQYTISGLVYDGTLTASMAVGALNDANENPLETAFSGTYAIDITSAPLPVPFNQAAPAGSLIYTDPGISGTLLFAGDSNSYTANLNSNQTLTVTVTGAASLEPTVQVTGPNSSVLGSASATSAGKSVIVQTAAVTTAGTYTITITGADGTIGAYAVGATLNAAANADNYSGATNQTLATAQSINSSFISLGGECTRGAVTGAPLSGSSTLSDYYSFSLNAGDSITLGVNAATAGSDSISLLNSSGTVLANGSSGPTNVDRAISNFIAPSTGTYYALVSAASGATSYDLVIVRNAILSLQPHNSFGTTQSLGGTLGALGDLSSTTSGDWYSINVTSTANVLAFSSTTPGGGAGQFSNTLIPHLEIYDPNGNLVATGSKLADGRNESVFYQPVMTGTYSIEVIAQNSTAGEYILSAGNILELSLPGNVNQSQGSATGTLTASNAPTSNLTINLTSSDPTRITAPASIVLPAGQTSVPVPLTIINNNLLEGPEAITITASGGSYFSATAVVTIHDNQTAVLTVSLPATARKNGGTISGTVTSSAPPAENVVVSLASNLTSALTVPATVTILAGQTTATFTATIVQNNMITGTEAATVSASVENWTTGSATINITDTDETITVGLPTSGWEGQTLTTASITLGGTVSSNFVVNLSSSNTSQMIVPATVTVAAGQSSVMFDVTLLNPGIKSGSHTATLTASASGFTSGLQAIVIHDSNLDYLGFSTITGPEIAGDSFGVIVSAYNIVNEVIAVYSGTGTLTAAGQSGNLSVTPSSVTFTSGMWTGNVMLTTADPAANLTLTSGGISVTSNSFAIEGGAVSSLAWSTVPTTEIENAPFPETITATDVYGNVASSYSGTATLSGLVGVTNYVTMLGTNTFTFSGTGGWSYGYYFTLKSNFLVTAVRSYYGTDVSIWDSNDNLIQSQTVSAPVGSWTNTNLTTPLQLYSGTKYLLSIYSGSNGAYYLHNGAPTKSSIVSSFGTSWYAGGDGFPVYSAEGYYPAVDLTGVTGSAYTTAPISPTSATFINGIWTGNIDVTQVETGMHLHVDDGAGQTADSITFNVSAPSVAFNTSTGNTSYFLELDSGGSNLQVWQEPYVSSGTTPTVPTGSPTNTYSISSIVNGVLFGGNGNSNVSLIIDETNGIIQPGSGMNINGGAGASGDYLTILLPTAGATVTVNSTTVTVGSSFINYSNLSAITVDGASGNDTLVQNAQPGGTLTFNGGTGNDTLTVNGGFFAFSGNPAMTTANLSLNDNSNVTLAAASSGGIQLLNFSQINIGPNAIAAVASAANHANRSLLISGGLSIASTGKLDLGSNDMLVHSGSLQTLNSELATGYNNGTWTGVGIASSAAAGNSSHLSALGMLLNNNGSGIPIYSSSSNSLGLFDGQSPLVTDILIKYTYYGDSNLDGHVDGSDYAKIDNGFLSQLTGWSNGNFNYDNTIDGSDYTLIDNAFNAQGASLTTSLTAELSPTAQIYNQQSPNPRRPKDTTHQNSIFAASNPFQTATPILLADSEELRVESLLLKKDVLEALSQSDFTVMPIP